MADTPDIEIGREVLPKTRVYLDIKYWIYLRDAARGQPADDSHARLLEVLRAGVARGTHVCPIEVTVFTELMKQGNLERRLDAARVMDQLSQRVALKPFEARVQAEVLHFLYSRLRPDATLHPVEELVWTRPMYMMGKMLPVPKHASPEAARWLQEQVDVLFRSYGIEQMLSTAGNDLTWPRSDTNALATYINTQNDAHTHEVRSAGQAYEVELRGAFAAFEPLLSEALKYFATLQPDYEAAMQATMAMTRHRPLVEYMADAALSDGAAQLFPTFHLIATAYSRVRWDQGRQYRPNDFEDFLHAAAALPYCNAFFTERSLSALVNQGADSLARVLGTHVVASPEEAIAFLGG